MAETIEKRLGKGSADAFAAVMYTSRISMIATVLFPAVVSILWRSKTRLDLRVWPSLKGVGPGAKGGLA